MEKIAISVVERKNLCFRNFLKISEDFLRELEQKNFAHIEGFERQRRALIQVITGLDNEAVQGSLSEFEKKLLAQNQVLISKIIEVDHKIIQYVTAYKAETLAALQAVQNGMKTLSAYRSPQDSVEHAEAVSIVDIET